MDILANYNTLFLLLQNLLVAVRYPNSLALRFVVGLYNEPFVPLLLLPVLDKSRCLIREYVGDREEIVVSGMLAFHLR